MRTSTKNDEFTIAMFDYRRVWWVYNPVYEYNMSIRQN